MSNPPLGSVPQTELRTSEPLTGYADPTKQIVILTGSELRHTFFRQFLGLSLGIRVLNTYCEDTGDTPRPGVSAAQSTDLRTRHLRAREQSEEDFFRLFLETTRDESRPIFLPKGAINSPGHVAAIVAANPQLLLAYGCSLVAEPLLAAFRGRFVNVHLGLSPYYRGSGTNYWPLVYGEPEFVGATFMHIAAGIDTGEVIHQVRARVAWGDTPALIGNRLIADMARECRGLVQEFESLDRMPQLAKPEWARLCRRKDYTDESARRLYANFSDGLVERYLMEEEMRCARSPIIQNPALTAQ